MKTQLGLSKTHFSHSRRSPIFGAGQGSAAAPTIWVVVSSRLFEIHEDHAFGASFRSPDGTISTGITMVGFVDDCYGSINDFESNYVPIHKLMKRAKFDAQLWSNLLSASGGALEPTKNWASNSL